jgi:glycerol-3-phosphate dehydrogenase
VVVGTTDTPVAAAALEPRPLPQEIEFLLGHAGRYLTGHPRASDVLSCFAGLRPLIAPAGGRHASDASGAGGVSGGLGGGTAALRRDHLVQVAPSGLVTITGGKWTTYRRMGQDAVDAAAAVAGLPDRPSVTATLRLHGAPAAEGGDGDPPLDDPELAGLVAERPEWGERLHPRLPYRAADVVRAARHEMARSVEDALARRTRALLLDARASVEAAPRTAALLAAELGRDDAWQRRQVAAYRELARGYWLE